MTSHTARPWYVLLAEGMVPLQPPVMLAGDVPSWINAKPGGITFVKADHPFYPDILIPADDVPDRWSSPTKRREYQS